MKFMINLSPLLILYLSALCITACEKDEPPRLAEAIDIPIDVVSTDSSQIQCPQFPTRIASESWRFTPLPLNFTNHTDGIFVFPDSDNGFYFHENFMARTRDRFATFDTIGSGMKINPVGAFFFDRQNGLLAEGTFWQGYAVTVFYKTTNGGESWTPLPHEEHPPFGWLQQLYFVNQDLGFAIATDQNRYSPGVLAKTLNGGKDWAFQSDVRIFPGNQTGSWIHFPDESTGFLISDKELLMSTDSGSSWRPLLVPGVPDHLLIADETTLFLATENNGLFRSEDLGNTWKKSYDSVEILHMVDEANGLFLQPLSVCSDELGYYSYAHLLELQDQDNWLVQDSIGRPFFKWIQFHDSHHGFTLIKGEAVIGNKAYRDPLVFMEYQPQ